MLMSTQILGSIILCLVGVLIILCNKYDFKIIEILGTVVCVAAILWFSGLIVTNFFGNVEATTEQHTIYEVDGRYIIYTGESATTPNVYIESNETKGAYTRKNVADAEIMIGEYEPHIDHTITIKKWLCYKITMHDYIIYLPETAK